MNTSWKPFEKAAGAGMNRAGTYAHARPGEAVMHPILSGLDHAGLLVTEERLESIAAAVEAIDVNGLTPAEVRALAADVVREGGAAL